MTDKQPPQQDWAGEAPATVNISEWDCQNLSLGQIGQLKQFATKAQAVKFARSIGWLARDPLRVHARLIGYLWIITDDHYRAIPRGYENGR